MKPSARIATLLIFLFFLFLNALQVYLVVERIAESKTKFNFACTDALVSSLLEYNKLKSIDSASMPHHVLMVYSRNRIEVNRKDSQSMELAVPSSTILTDTVSPASIEGILNRPYFTSLDRVVFEKLFRKALDTLLVNPEYRLDTIHEQETKMDRRRVQMAWERKKNKDYPYATRPVRIPQYASFSVFAEFKYDTAFLKNDLLWPLVAFAFTLLISNTALVFVYNTIRKQKRINEVKTDFINNITHEMKTPITIASASFDALEHHVSLTERTGFYLQTGKKQLLLLNDFAERILEAAVRDVSDFSLKKEPVDLHVLFAELVENHSILQGKPANFRLGGKNAVVIEGDRLYLQAAFNNMIDNAIKYSNASVNIDIDLAENTRDAVIKIRDNGMGIPPQFVKNIFEKFFRVPQGDAQPVKGFGLGLYYVNSIIKKHSGSIQVHSKWQSGTEFTITLPKYT